MRGRSKRFVAVALFTALLIILVNLAWWLYYRRTAAMLEDQLSRRLTALATTASRALNPLDVDLLTMGDADAFLSISEFLEHVRRSDSLAEVFLLDENYHVLATSSLESDSVYFLTALNSPYIDSVVYAARPTTVISETYKTGSVFLKTAFAPVYGTGNVLEGVLGVEASVDYFDALAELRRNLYYSSALSLVGGLLLGILFIILQRRINAAEQRLFLSETESYLGRMVSVVAHELKNPLMIIRGSAERVRKRTQSEEAGYILEEVDRLNDIVSGYLDFSRTSRSMVAAEAPERFDLIELTTSLKRHIHDKYADHSIEWLDAPEADRLEMVGYRRSLRQVLLNLLMNGVESCLAAGKPIRIGIQVEDARNRVTISVLDHGQGMSRQQQRRLYDPFFTTKQSGSGLGLYVSRRIVRDMQGSIEIDSREGQGTTVRVTLPKRSEE